MAQGARIESTELLTEFRTALWKFQAEANAALGDAESELRRTLIWLETEQDSFWKDQIRKRHEVVERCKEAVRMKKLFKDASGKTPSAVEEQKALQVAMRRLAEAQEKHANVRRWVRQLQKEIEMYKGSVQRLTTSVETLIPAGAAYLDRLALDLEQYLAVKVASSAVGAGSTAESVAVGGSEMARGTQAGQVQPAANMSEAFTLPTPEERQNAAADSNLDVAVPAISEEQLSVVAELPIESATPELEKKVTVNQAVAKADRMMLYHAQPAFDGDSGWCVLALGAAAGGWLSMSVADILKIRQDWKQIVTLPIGFSVILDGHGIVVVKDAQEQDVWRATASGTSVSKSA